MPTVTDWISSIGSLVGALTGIGALIVAVLSYLRSGRALAADARTRAAVGSTLDAIDLLSAPRRVQTVLPRPDTDLPQEQWDAVDAALADARRELGQPVDGRRPPGA